MTNYILLKKSQIPFFKEVPFYYLTQNGEYALYKKKGDYLNDSRLNASNFPDLYILEEDQESAMLELTKALNEDLKKKVNEGRLKDVRMALAAIMEEALAPGQEKNIKALPETIEILIYKYSRDHSALGMLSQIGSNSSVLVEHTVNVTALTLQFCFYHNLPESDTQKLSLAAMLHDVGCAKIEKKIIESQKKLTDEQFSIYKNHTKLGHEIITENANFDISVSKVALEHHERLDGSGFPNGLRGISAYSQLIGLIDSYEYLTYRGKLFRKKLKPYETLSIIKNELSEKKFAKEVFKRFTACLVR